MGKKGSWFSAIKRVFIPSSKDKLVDESEKRSTKEKKKKGLGKLKHGDSFIPFFRETSSIEKILGEAEREHHLIDFRPLGTLEQPRTPSLLPSRDATPLQNATSPWAPAPPRVASPPRSSSSRRVASPPRAATLQRVASPPKGSMSRRMASSPKGATPYKSATLQRMVSPPRISAPREVISSSQAATSSNAAAPPKSASSKFVYRPRPEPTLRYQHICATRIQAAYKGYTARRSYRALRGLVRLQGVVKGQSVKRQTVNAMKCMQLLVRVQTQIQSRRIQMLENQALQRQALHKNDKDFENSMGKWNLSQMAENGNLDEWDDSLLTKEEIEARTQRKFEAIIKRERAMAYAYSHQLWKASKTSQGTLMASGGFPWWWNWLDRHTYPSTTATKPSETQAIKSLHSTPARPAMASPLMPRSSNYSQQNLGFNNLDTALATPRSTRSAAVPSRMKLSPTPPSKVLGNKLTRPRATAANNSPLNAHFKDDDSLTSCPPFSGPRYMEATVSANAKLKGGFGVSPDAQSKRRVSFPLAQGIGSFKWNKRGSLFSATNTPTRENRSQRVLEKKQSTGNLSVDSTISMPATVGRKPFNRFV